MCTPEVKLVQDALAGFAAGRPEEYMNIVDDNIKFSVLGGLLPDAVAVGNSKADFMKCAEAQSEHMEIFRMIPHSWTGHGPHVGFVVDWEVKWKATGEVHCLKAVVRKLVKNGKIVEKWHCIDQHQAAKITNKPHTEGAGMTPEVALVQKALFDGVMVGKFENYMNVVADNLDFDVCGGLLPDDKTVGNTKEAFMACGGAQGEMLEQIRFVPHSWTGYGEHVLFCVDWEWKLKTAEGQKWTQQAVVHKQVRNGKICTKYHLLDQYCATRMNKIFNNSKK